jgi:hypothetical protein
MLICTSGCRPLISPSNRNCWRPLWTVRGKPLPLPAVFPEGILANTGRKKQAKNAAEIQRVRKSGGPKLCLKELRLKELRLKDCNWAARSVSLNCYGRPRPVSTASSSRLARARSSSVRLRRSRRRSAGRTSGRVMVFRSARDTRGDSAYRKCPCHHTPRFVSGHGLQPCHKEANKDAALAAGLFP